MFKIFGGMILGSVITMVLLGGASAANQVLTNVHDLYLIQFNRPDTVTTLILLALLSVFLAAITAWPSKPVYESKKIINRLRRHC